MVFSFTFSDYDRFYPIFLVSNARKFRFLLTNICSNILYKNSESQKGKKDWQLNAFMSLFDPIKKLVSTRSCLPNGPPAKCDSQYTSSNLIHNPFLLTSFLLFRAFGGIQKRRINSDPHFSPQRKARISTPWSMNIRTFFRTRPAPHFMTLGEKMKYGKKGFYESPIRNLEGLKWQ